MIPGLGRAFRTLVFFDAEKDFHKLFPDTDYAAKERKKIEGDLIAHMKRVSQLLRPLIFLFGHFTSSRICLGSTCPSSWPRRENANSEIL